MSKSQIGDIPASSMARLEASEMEEKSEVHRLLLPKIHWNGKQKINLYSKIEVITKIKENLSEKQINMFKNGCFGHLLDIQINKFPSQLMHHLVIRQCQNDNPHELCFNIEGNIAKFGLREFALITGLNCDDLPENEAKNPREGSNFKDKFFPSQRKISRKILNAKFEAHNDEFEGSDEDIVKLANLYCLESLIIPRQEKINLDPGHMRMVDDDGIFHKYPWGKISYDMTIDSVKKGLNSHDADAYGIGGFPYALVVWAFEIIPTLCARGFVAKIDRVLIPRVLNWISNSQPSWKDLNKSVFETQHLEVKPIEVSRAEMEQPFVAIFLKDEIKDQNSKKRKAAVSEQEERSDSQNLESVTLQQINRQLKELLGKSNQMDKKIDEISKMISVIYEELTGKKFVDEFDDMHEDGRENTPIIKLEN